MNLVLCQKNTIASRPSRKRFDQHLLKPLSRRWKVLRLRAKRPQWIRIALLVFAADIVLAASAWVVVDLLR